MSHYSVAQSRFFVTVWTAACQASLFFTISQSLLKLLSIESVMPSNHLLLCCHLLLPSIFPSIKVDMLIICHLWIIYVHLIRSCDL